MIRWRTALSLAGIGFACSDGTGPAAASGVRVEHVLVVREVDAARAVARRCTGRFAVRRREGNTLLATLVIDRGGDCPRPMAASLEGIVDRFDRGNFRVILDRAALREILGGCDVAGDPPPFQGNIGFGLTLSLQAALSCPEGSRLLFWEVEETR